MRICLPDRVLGERLSSFSWAESVLCKNASRCIRPVCSAVFAYGRSFRWDGDRSPWLLIRTFFSSLTPNADYHFDEEIKKNISRFLSHNLSAKIFSVHYTSVYCIFKINAVLNRPSGGLSWRDTHPFPTAFGAQLAMAVRASRALASGVPEVR